MTIISANSNPMLSPQLYAPTLSLPPSLAPLPLTEPLLTTQLLHLLQGLPSPLFTLRPHTQQYQLSSKYEMNHLSSNAIKSAIAGVLRYCNEMKYVEMEMRKLYRNGGAVVGSFCEGVWGYLAGVRGEFAGVLAEVGGYQQGEEDKGRVTLLGLEERVRPKTQMMSFLIRCINTCAIEAQSKPQSIRLLDKLHEISLQLQSHVPENTRHLTLIFKRTLKMYFTIIYNYLQMHTLAPEMQFFAPGQDTDEGFLQRGGEVIPERVPKMIENQARSVVEIGKTIRFIGLYYRDYELEKLMRYIDVEGEFRGLFGELQAEEVGRFGRVGVRRAGMNQRIRNRNKKPIVEAKPLPEDNPFGIFTQDMNLFPVAWLTPTTITPTTITQPQVCTEPTPNFTLWIRTVLIHTLQKINKKCLPFLRSPHDPLTPDQPNRIQVSLNNTLTGIHKFMLLEQGDFVEQFLSAAENIIDMERALVSHERIYGCIDEAVEKSNARYLQKQILANVHFDYIKTDHIKGEKRQRIKLWMMLCFVYRCAGPMSHIFTSGLMDKLKQICSLIFRLKRSQLTLTKIWHNSPSTISLAPTLRLSMHTTLTQCLSYLVVHLSTLWHQYLVLIPTLPTLFDLITETHALVARMQQVSIDDKILCNGIEMGLAAVEGLGHGDGQGVEWQWRQAVELLGRVAELGAVVNFNGYYDRL